MSFSLWQPMTQSRDEDYKPADKQDLARPPYHTVPTGAPSSLLLFIAALKNLCQ